MEIIKYIKTNRIIQLIPTYEIRRLINSFGWEYIKNICFKEVFNVEKRTLFLDDACWNPQLK